MTPVLPSLTSYPCVLGFDPGFASFGYAVIHLVPEGLHVTSMGVIRTEKSAKKRHILATEDNLQRAQEIARFLRSLVALTKPRAFCAESMSFPRSSSVAAKMAMAWGILADLSVDIPFVQVTPQQLKKAVTGSKLATKEDIQSVIRRSTQFVQSTPAFDAFEASLARSFHEHGYDSVGSVVAAHDSEVFKMLRNTPLPRDPPSHPCADSTR